MFFNVTKALCGSALSFTANIFPIKMALNVCRCSALLSKLNSTQVIMCRNLVTVHSYHFGITKCLDFVLIVLKPVLSSHFTITKKVLHFCFTNCWMHSWHLEVFTFYCVLQKMGAFTFTFTHYVQDCYIIHIPFLSLFVTLSKADLTAAWGQARGGNSCELSFMNEPWFPWRWLGVASGVIVYFIVGQMRVMAPSLRIWNSLPIQGKHPVSGGRRVLSRFIRLDGLIQNSRFETYCTAY